MGDDLVAFLRARIDEDEWTATDDGRRRGDEWTAMEPVPRSNVIAEIMVRGTPVPLCRTDAAMAVHIARHDPVRVLREVEAKRRIVDLHSGAHECSTFEDNCTWIDAEFNRLYCDTLRLLALPYDQHPNYDEAWKP